MTSFGADGVTHRRPRPSASNTTPVLVLRFEGQTDTALERIRHDMLALLQQVKPGASLQESAH